MIRAHFGCQWHYVVTDTHNPRTENSTHNLHYPDTSLSNPLITHFNISSCFSLSLRVCVEC